MFRAVGSHSLPPLTAPAGTPIAAIIPPQLATPPAYLRIVSLSYLCPGTPHTITLLKALWRTTLASAVAAGASTLTLAEDLGASPVATPAGALAAGDWICVQLDDGTFWLAESTALSTLTLTLSQTVPYAAAAGRTVWVFGVPADHDGTNYYRRRRTNDYRGAQYRAQPLGLSTWEGAAAGLVQTLRSADPIMLHVDNVAEAGRVETCVGVYTLN